MSAPHKSHWIADKEKISSALQEIEEATRACDEGDLRTLHADGVLPTGVLNYLLACRVKINGY